MTDKKNGREYLGYVLEKLKEGITEISLSLVEGQRPDVHYQSVWRI